MRSLVAVFSVSAIFVCVAVFFNNGHVQLVSVASRNQTATHQQRYHTDCLNFHNQFPIKRVNASAANFHPPPSLTYVSVTINGFTTSLPPTTAVR
jgi:hypothetical protein